MGLYLHANIDELFALPTLFCGRLKLLDKPGAWKFKVVKMKKDVARFAVIAAAVAFAANSHAQKPTPDLKLAQKRVLPQIMPVSELKRGMRGVAYTVFEGTKPEAMEVEVLGVLKNINGPKSDIILVRLRGAKVEYTGVVAGMSGSPVYIDGKLVGALAFRIGAFSKEPIAGLTPIADMLEIDELDRSIPSENARGSKPRIENTKTNSAATEADVKNYAQYLVPIETPLVFNGFSEDTVKQFASQFVSSGIVPVMGAGGSSREKQPDPIQPGSAVSAILVQGDMNIAGTCTVTYMDPEHLLACGHPLLQYGAVDLPMTKADVVATLPSPLNAFKIVNTTEPIGAFVQDRHTGIMGTFDKAPHMIPVTLSIHGGPQPKSFHYAVLNNPRLTPIAMMATVYQALQGTNEYGEEITYRMNGNIKVSGYPDVRMQNMFSANDSQPSAMGVALSLGDRFGRIFDNSYSAPEVDGVNIDFDLVAERRSARLETARTDVTEARPGDDIVVEAVLRPYRGESIVRQIPIKIPTSAPRGNLRILVSDADSLDRTRRFAANIGRKLDLASTIAMLNKEHLNHHLYVSLLEPNPQAMVEDKVMPGLPLSVINVMDGMRGTQEMLLTAESAVNESSVPLDYVVSGAQVITIQVK